MRTFPYISHIILLKITPLKNKVMEFKKNFIQWISCYRHLKIKKHNWFKTYIFRVSQITNLYPIPPPSNLNCCFFKENRRYLQGLWRTHLLEQPTQWLELTRCQHWQTRSSQIQTVRSTSSRQQQNTEILTHSLTQGPISHYTTLLHSFICARNWAILLTSRPGTDPHGKERGRDGLDRGTSSLSKGWRLVWVQDRPLHSVSQSHTPFSTLPSHCLALLSP